MLRYFFQLLKFKLSITVVFSAIAGYLLGFDQFNAEHFIYLVIGGFLVTGSANAFNQILENDKDKLMERTAVRPLPQGNLSIPQAFLFAILIGIIGLCLLNQINPQGSFYGFMSKSSFFGLISILLYVLSYTPLKRISTISIFVGAIPGAIPFLLGFVAATDNFGLAAGTLFAIQFLWQFPHFIAISWVLDKEYKEAGFKMLFGGEKNKYPALISVLTSGLMTVISVLPFFYISELSLSIYGVIIILILGVWFSFKSFKLLKNTDDESARELMLSSFAYLPLMQIVYVLDRALF
ncbi:heme o synthase [Flavobacteriales bacterium]|nr:heme o synthase [Flavobacteriales bacterium]